jgi:hypothetical protein
MPGSPTRSTAWPRPFSLPKKAVQDAQLSLAIDKNCRERRWRFAEPRAAVRNTDQAIRQDGLGLALEGERSDGLDTSVTLRQQPGRLAQQDRSRLGCFLQSSGDIGCIADRSGLHR